MTNYFFHDPIIRDIPDFPNYQISEDGVVYNRVSGRELKTWISKGYAFAKYDEHHNLW